jgi:hypothetical protein
VGGAIVMVTVLILMAGITIYLVGAMTRSIHNEKSTSMKLWKNFGLSLAFCTLFLLSWIGQGAAQWQRFTDDAKEHGEKAELGDFFADFSASTLENWQSEFLQLFSFTVITAILIHKGSAESRDTDDRVEAAIKRIEDHLGTEPTLRDEPLRKSEDLHVVPDGFEGWMLKDESSPEPEGYYDCQEDAIQAGRELASKKRVNLVIHGEDGTPRRS